MSLHRVPTWTARRWTKVEPATSDQFSLHHCGFLNLYSRWHLGVLHNTESELLRIPDSGVPDNVEREEGRWTSHRLPPPIQCRVNTLSSTNKGDGRRVTYPRTTSRLSLSEVQTRVFSQCRKVRVSSHLPSYTMGLRKRGGNKSLTLPPNATIVENVDGKSSKAREQNTGPPYSIRLWSLTRSSTS